MHKDTLGWLNRFGRTAIFVKNDIKLILRNKRSKMTIWVSIDFLFYGLLFFTDSSGGLYNDYPVWKIFAGIFVTGGFLFTFGQYVPSWDSSYYPLMMSQNIVYREYLERQMGDDYNRHLGQYSVGKFLYHLRLGCLCSNSHRCNLQHWRQWALGFAFRGVYQNPN